MEVGEQCSVRVQTSIEEEIWGEVCRKLEEQQREIQGLIMDGWRGGEYCKGFTFRDLQIFEGGQDTLAFSEYTPYTTNFPPRRT